MMGAGRGGPGGQRDSMGGRDQRRPGGNPKREGGEYNKNGYFYPNMAKTLVSFQQFSSLQTRQSQVFHIKEEYKRYAGKHKSKHAKAFWTEHEKEPWFMEKYNPMTIYQSKQEQMELVR